MLADGFCQHRISGSRENLETLVVHALSECAVLSCTYQAWSPRQHRKPSAGTDNLRFRTDFSESPRIKREAFQSRNDCGPDHDTGRETPSRKRKSDRAETQQRLGAPLLGSGKLQTPPNRYPPARLLSLRFEAIPA